VRREVPIDKADGTAVRSLCVFFIVSSSLVTCEQVEKIVEEGGRAGPALAGWHPLSRAVGRAICPRVQFAVTGVILFLC